MAERIISPEIVSNPTHPNPSHRQCRPLNVDRQFVLPGNPISKLTHRNGDAKCPECNATDVDEIHMTPLRVMRPSIEMVDCWNVHGADEKVTVLLTATPILTLTVDD